MIIWGAMIVPVIVDLVLYSQFSYRMYDWWFYLIPFIVSALLVALMRYLIENYQTTDTEFWGGWATSAAYFEPWNERVSCRHPEYEWVTHTHTDADGNTHTTSSYEWTGRYEHAYDVDKHPACWVLYDSNGNSRYISEKRFERLANLWSNRKFVDLGRNFHTYDGDKYVTTWDGKDTTFIPVTTSHEYENRAQPLTSKFGFKKVDPEALGLFEYPEISSLDQPAVLGASGDDAKEADRRLRFWNAKLGSSKQVRMFVLVFGPDSSCATAKAQEQYWRGGNKNEFILAVGLSDSGRVNWAHVISWTDKFSLKEDVRRHVEGLDCPSLTEIVEYLVVEVKERFVRKSFADFKDLEVKPPNWAIVLTYGLAILVNTGIGWLFVNG